MLYTLIVKPLALAALGGVLWLLWRATGHVAPGEVGRARALVGLGTAVILALVLGPPAWAALRDRPGEVLAWGVGLAAAAAVAWAYARLIGAARRRAGRRRDGDG